MRSDPLPCRTEGLEMWKVCVARGDAKDKVEELIRLAEAGGSDVLIVRSDMVFGGDHVRSALYHARGAFEQGRNVSTSLAMETLLYASGERQLSSAIRKMSVPSDAEDFVLAVLSGPFTVPADGITDLTAAAEPRVADLLRFGISESEISTMEGRNPNELVLERVAAVDVMKK